MSERKTWAGMSDVVPGFRRLGLHSLRSLAVFNVSGESLWMESYPATRAARAPPPIEGSSGLPRERHLQPGEGLTQLGEGAGSPARHAPAHRETQERGTHRRIA